MSVLVTGGAGYIGSHTVVELLNRGEKIIIVDNFSNSKPEMLNKIRKITNKDFKFYEVDLLDRENLDKVFAENSDIESVIHFAGLKAVGESVEKPIEYYHNNITGTLILLDVMKKYNCKKIVFSSSATVYGDPATVPIREDFPLSTTNPYGSTKLMIEQILQDVAVADKDFCIAILRYFNPIGAHESGLIGEVPNGIPNNIMPYIMKVAKGEYKELTIFGDDYPTKDGTGVRDYIHVVDLSKGHLKALDKIRKEAGVKIYNLGTGNGYSVLELVKNFEKVNNVKVNYKIGPRRPGDIPACYADPRKAEKELGWKAEKGIEEMLKDSWNFVNKN